MSKTIYILPKTCYNCLVVEATNADGELQLEKLLQKSKIPNRVFSFRGWIPPANAVDHYLYPHSPIGLGMVILHKRNSEEIKNSDLKEIEKHFYHEYKPQITSDDLESHLIRTGQADLENGQKAYEYYKNFGIIDENEWAKEKWGTTSDCIEPEIIYRKANKVIIDFKTHSAPPTEWLEKVSLDLPNLNFFLYWDMENEATFYSIKNGIFTEIEYDEFDYHRDEQAKRFCDNLDKTNNITGLQ
ncbi:MAG TPA: hypothetical protein VFF33_14065 [Ignavibacteriaceae bacterium]|nr:hypothetical protein [Ignavibacteriaceae bacterium]